MELSTKITLILLGAIIIIAAMVGGMVLFDSGADVDYEELDPKYLSVYDEDDTCFYIPKAAADIEFRVKADSSKSKPQYTLEDANGDTIKVKSKKLSDGSYLVLAPEDGYTAGETYTLSLKSNTTFCDSNLTGAKQIIFKIEREAVVEYEFAEEVVESRDVILEAHDSTINVSELDVTPGEVVLGKDENGNPVAYKVEEVSSDGTATVTVPALDEVYEDLNVYGEYTIDPSEIITNPDLEIEIVENLKKSEFYSAFITAVSAASIDAGEPDFDVEVVIPYDDTDSLDVTIKINLHPNENGLFGDNTFLHHSLTLTLKFKLWFSLLYDIESSKQWDICTTITSDFSWDLALSNEENEEDILNHILSDDKSFDNPLSVHKDKLREISDTLNEISNDSLTCDIKLFDLKVGTPVPGIYVDLEIKYYMDFSVAVSLSVGQEITTVCTVGMTFADEDFDFYSNWRNISKDFHFSLGGKASASTGFKAAMKLVILSDKIAYVQIEPKVGLYLDLYALLPLTNSGIGEYSEAYYYFEPGGCFGAELSAKVRLLSKPCEVSLSIIEKKFPIEEWVLGTDKIYTGAFVDKETVEVVNGVCTLPKFFATYYDVKSGTAKSECISYDDLQIDLPKDIKCEMDGDKLTLTEESDSDTFYVSASYIPEDGATFEVEIEISVISYATTPIDPDVLVGDWIIYTEHDHDTIIWDVVLYDNGDVSIGTGYYDGYVLLYVGTWSITSSNASECVISFELTGEIGDSESYTTSVKAQIDGNFMKLQKLSGDEIIAILYDQWYEHIYDRYD